MEIIYQHFSKLRELYITEEYPVATAQIHIFPTGNLFTKQKQTKKQTVVNIVVLKHSPTILY